MNPRRADRPRSFHFLDAWAAWAPRWDELPQNPRRLTVAEAQTLGAAARNYADFRVFWRDSSYVTARDDARRAAASADLFS